MDWSESLTDVEALLAEIESIQTQVTPDIEDGLIRAGQLCDAARKVGESSSGSWVGWHAKMYYGNYDEPPLRDSWDTEWGSINGFSQMWQQRSLADVQRAIEQEAGVTLADVAHIADRVREPCQRLQQRLLTLVSPICDLAGLEKEADALKKLEETEWIVAPANYVRLLAPSRIVSRDSHAASQGMQAPLHLEVEGAIVSNNSTLATARQFLIDALRLARQVRTKLRAQPARQQSASAASVNGSDRNLQRELRHRSVGLFVVLALLIVAGELWSLSVFAHGRLAAAVIVVAGAIAGGGAYAWLINRAHVRWAFVVGAGALGAIAAVDQLLGHILP